jgi:hypothetical protein
MRRWLFAAAILFVGGVVSAGTITVNGDVNDTSVGVGTNNPPLTLLWIGQAEERAGGNNYPFGKGDTVVVYVFQLPVLPGGHIVSAANLSFDANNNFETVWNIDLYGVRSAATSTVLTNDWSYGPGASGTLIQDNILTPVATTTWANRNTDATGQTNLAVWLNQQYTVIGSGGYVFLRLNPDNATSVPTGDATTTPLQWQTAQLMQNRFSH